MPSRLPYFASCHGGKATIPEGVTLLHLEYDVASGLQLAAVARDVHTLCLCLYSFLSLFLCSSFVSFSLSLSISLFVPLSLLQVRNTSGCFPACFFAEKGQKTNSKPKWQRGCALCHLSLLVQGLQHISQARKQGVAQPLLMTCRDSKTNELRLPGSGGFHPEVPNNIRS